MTLKELSIIFMVLYVGQCAVLNSSAGKHDKAPVKKVLEGDNLLIVCNATPSTETEIFWVKNDTKSTFRENGTELTFIYINRNSAGDYICYSFNLTAENETEANATVVQVVTIDVLYPAEVTDFSIGPLTVTENGTFTISCKMVGNPNPVWSIMNNRTKVGMMSATMAAEATLTSWPVRCEDAGFWMCTGHNDLNNHVNATRGGNVTILCAPKPNREADVQYQIKSRPGMPAYLIMNNYGYPYPSYTWTHNGEILPRSRHIDHMWYSIVNISSVQVKDFGKYTLTMRNSIGSYVADYELQPMGGPEPPRDLWHSDVTSHSVRLHWTSGYDMGYQQHFVIMKWTGNVFIQMSDIVYDYSHNHGVDDKFTHTVANLESGTYYKLSVAAENGYGSPGFSKEYVEFTTSYDPVNPTESSDSKTIALVVGCSVGGLALIGLLAFLVYLKAYRNLQTSYEPMKGKTINGC